MVKHVVMWSGGVASYCTAKRVAQEHGTENLTLLFADTMMEDQDLYRFNTEAAQDVGGRFVRLADGRDPWTVFHDERFLGNSRVDPCSKILKRKLLDKWRDENCDPMMDRIYVGYDWTEGHRFEKLQKYVVGWKYEAPLMEPPLMDKAAQLRACKAAGIRIPRLYELGFQHNNCGGFCVKAGQAAFKLLLETMPERYAYHERKEQELRDYLGKDVTILKHRGGPKKGQSMTLREFRERVQAKGEIDLFDWGACSCLTKAES
jgi:hypothetical protein